MRYLWEVDWITKRYHVFVSNGCFNNKPPCALCAFMHYRFKPKFSLTAVKPKPSGDSYLKNKTTTNLGLT